MLENHESFRQIICLGMSNSYLFNHKKLGILFGLNRTGLLFDFPDIGATNTAETGDPNGNSCRT